MSILYLVADYPETIKRGNQSATDQQIRYLSENNNCTVVGFCDPQILVKKSGGNKERSKVKEIYLERWADGPRLNLRRIKYIIRFEPIFLARFYNKKMYEHIKRIVGETKFDLVFMDGLPMAQYIGAIGDVPIVMSTVDAASRVCEQKMIATRRIHMKLAYYANMLITLNYEKSILPKANLIHVFSEEDKKYLEKRVPKASVVAIPMSLSREIICHQETGGEDYDIFINGSASVEGVREGIKSYLINMHGDLRKKFPYLETHLIAQNVPPRIKSIIEKEEGIKFAEWVDDYWGEMSRAKVVFIPDVSGTGIKTRVIQAMALGKPVVGRDVAFKGIDCAADGENCIIRNSKGEMIEAIMELLSDHRKRETLGRRAQNDARERYNPDSIKSKWNDTLKRAVQYKNK